MSENKPDLAAIPNAVPLIEQLRSVPIKAREMIEINKTHHRSIPYGRLCHDAANEIDRLAAARAALPRAEGGKTCREYRRGDGYWVHEDVNGRQWLVDNCPHAPGWEEEPAMELLNRKIIEARADNYDSCVLGVGQLDRISRALAAEQGRAENAEWKVKNLKSQQINERARTDAAESRIAALEARIANKDSLYDLLETSHNELARQLSEAKARLENCKRCFICY